MKTLIAALAGAALIITPMAAQAQHSGGHGGGFHGGGFHGGGFHGGGFHGGFRGGGFRGGFHRGFFGDPFFFGAGLGLGYYYADPWFWGYPGYGYYGYPAYDDDDSYGGASYGGGSSGYYRGSMPSDDGPGAPGPNDRAAAPPSANGPAQACGSWRWDSSAQKYQWDGC